MTTYGRTPKDVVRWPFDPAARRALEVYLSSLQPDSADVLTMLDAEDLDFTGADLSGLEFLGAILSGAILDGVSLAGADLGRAWLNGARLRVADLSHVNLWKAEGRACEAQGATFRGAVFDRCDFERASLRHANLTQARFGSGSLSDADLRDSSLRSCVFGHGRLTTTLSRTRIGGCQVEGASGTVSGPADVGTTAPRLLDGADLQRWFTDHGAPLVQVRAIS